jgi:hypothetical protein
LSFLEADIIWLILSYPQRLFFTFFFCFCGFCAAFQLINLNGDKLMRVVHLFAAAAAAAAEFQSKNRVLFASIDIKKTVDNFA